MSRLKDQSGRLGTFVRNECANYDSHYGGCLFEDFGGKCAVVDLGKPCRYFERAVLGPPDYPYKTAGYDWGRLFAAYGQINPTFAGRGVTVRRCECGAVLSTRERVCEKCREGRRKATYRAAQQKRRRERVGVNS